MDQQISKDEFKRIYFENSLPDSGWTQDYWDQFFEQEEGNQYFVTTPYEPGLRMFISSGADSHRIFFLDEDAEERFFHQPGTRD